MRLLILRLDLLPDALVATNIVLVVLLEVGQDNVPLLGLCWILVRGRAAQLQRLTPSCLQKLEVLVAHQVNEEVSVLVRILRCAGTLVGDGLVEHVDELQVAELSAGLAADVLQVVGWELPLPHLVVDQGDQQEVELLLLCVDDDLVGVVAAELDVVLVLEGQSHRSAHFGGDLGTLLE